TVLRVANRRGRCNGGANDQNACATDTDCPGGTCGAACAGGPNDGLACMSDSDCANGGRCGRLFEPAGFESAAKTGGPIVLPRALPRICQLPPHEECKNNGECTGVGNLCLSYALEARGPVDLDSLNAGTEQVFA